MFGMFSKKSTTNNSDELVVLLQKKIKSEITDKEYLDKIRELRPNDWKSFIDTNNYMIMQATQEFNDSIISMVEYKERLRELGSDSWKKYATLEEIEILAAQDAFDNGEISYTEMSKRIATVEKRPFFTVSEISVDEEKPDRPFFFSFDWNSYFIDDLKQRGYNGTIDSDYVDSWWLHLCTIIAAENESVIVTNPMEYRRIKALEGHKTEHY